MIEHLVQRPSAVARHRGTLCGPYLDGYLGQLRDDGYGVVVRNQHLFVITRFGEYLKRQRIKRLTEVDEGVEAGFVGFEKRRLRGCRGRARRLDDCRRIIAAFLLHVGVRTVCLVEERSSVLSAYCRWQRVDRGLQPITVEGYRYALERFLDHLGSDGSTVSLGRLTAADVDAFVVAMGRRYGRKSISSRCTAVRSLLRFLYLRGILDRDLSPSVVMPKFYPLERLPCALPWDVVKQVVDLAEAATATGRRDRAILLLLVTYGVRAGEIVKLRLEDIDWRSEVIHFRRSKSGRPLRCPLTLEVGEAILAYLQDGRPATPAREVFIRFMAPHKAFSRGGAVSLLVRRYLRKAGVEARSMGAHLIRHSLAVHLLRQHHPLKTISDMLGHRDPTVAYHYTKLDLDALEGVALDAAPVLP